MSEKEVNGYKKIFNGLIIAIVGSLALSVFTFARTALVDHAKLVQIHETYVSREAIMSYFDLVEERHRALEKSYEAYKTDAKEKYIELQKEINDINQMIIKLISQNSLTFRGNGSD